MPRRRNGPAEGVPRATRSASSEAFPGIYSEVLKNEGFRPILDEHGETITSNLSPLPKGQWNTYTVLAGTTPHFLTVVCDEEGKLWTKHSGSPSQVELTNFKHNGFKRGKLQGAEWGTPSPLNGVQLMKINVFQHESGEFLFNAYRNGALPELGVEGFRQLIAKLEELKQNPTFSSSVELNTALAELEDKLVAEIKNRKY